MTPPMQLVPPALDRLPSYVAALKRGWSPDNIKGAAAAVWLCSAEASYVFWTDARSRWWHDDRGVCSFLTPCFQDQTMSGLLPGWVQRAGRPDCDVSHGI